MKNKIFKLIRKYFPKVFAWLITKTDSKNEKLRKIAVAAKEVNEAKEMIEKITKDGVITLDELKEAAPEVIEGVVALMNLVGLTKITVKKK